MGRISIEIVNEQAVMAIKPAALHRTAAFVCRQRKITRADISVAVVNDAIIRRLKKQYFGQSIVTDVISFDLGGASTGRKSAEPLEAEVVINAQQALRTAKRLAADPAQELHLYLIHGLLHLMGFDDRTRESAAKMHRAEGRLLRELGFNDVGARKLSALNGTSDTHNIISQTRLSKSVLSESVNMQAIKDQAVCLRRQNYSETSQIVTLFTQGHGKVRAMAKGARRSRGQFSGGLDLFSVGHMIFAPGRGDSGLATLTEFDLINDFSGLRRRLINLHCVEYAASLLADLTEDMDPHENLYETFIQSVEEWSGTDSPEKTLVRFELQLFTAVGLSPVWHVCSLCQGELASSPRLAFHTRQGGVLCARCSTRLSPVQAVSHEVIKILGNPEQVEAADRALSIEAHELLAHYAVELSGRKKPIVGFLTQLLKKGGL